MTECMLGVQEVVNPETGKVEIMISCPLAKSGLCGYEKRNRLPKRFNEVGRDTPAYPFTKNLSIKLSFQSTDVDVVGRNSQKNKSLV